ncbi:hypothetical protein [Cryobacterium sp. Y62]|uniref:hypothetical protein n=1 Tax=Cryobacterium sp. Y62 TaxID=2048284 RepID=UPI0011B067B6|nr:hypothetical protein [Cryobacterium sp. Y62]
MKINAANVTIKNSIIRGRTNKPGVLIHNMGGFSNLVPTDTEIFPTVMSNNKHGIYGYNFTAIPTTSTAASSRRRRPPSITRATCSPTAPPSPSTRAKA